MEEDEEYAIEGPPQKKLLETPEGLMRRRARLYYDRTDCRGKCLHVTCSCWGWIFGLENLLKAVLIVGCGVVGEYAALKRGGGLEQAATEGWILGIFCYIMLLFVSEMAYRLSDEKTTRRGIKDETSFCSIFSYLVTVILLCVILGVFAAVHEYCVEGVSCQLPDNLNILGSGGGKR